MPSQPSELKSRLLNPHQERFCQEYLIDLNGTAAYERAGYKARGDAAGANAARLLTHARIVARIAELQKARAERTQITQDLVLGEIALLGCSDVQHYTITDDGRVEIDPAAPPGARRAVASVRRRTHYLKDGEKIVTVELRLWDKPAALRMLGEHLGLFRKKLEIDVPGGVLVVPGPVGTEEWAKVAAEEQRKLGAQIALVA